MKKAPVLIGLLLILFSTLAQANILPIDFTPSPDNSAMKALFMIFGQSIYDNGADAGLLGAMFKIFNLGALLFGTILVAYGTVVGTVATATDGQLLGKQWSSAWVPLRIAGASALLVPGTNGISMIQHAVLYVAIQGVGLGDITWLNGLNYMANAASEPIVHAQVSTMTPNTVRNIILSEVCVRNLNKVMADSSAGNPDQPVPVFGHRIVPAPGNKGIIATWGMISGEKGSYSSTQCGSMKFSPPVSKDSQIADVQLRIGVAHASTLIKLVDMAGPVADALVVTPVDGATLQSTGAPRIDLMVQGLNEFYAAQLRDSSISAVASGDQAIRGRALQTVKDEGWLMAGKWFWILGKANDEIRSVAGSVPTYKSPKMSNLPKQVQDQIIGLNIYSTEQLGSSAQAGSMEQSEQAAVDREEAMQDAGDGTESLMTRAVAPVTEKVSYSLTKWLAESMGIDGEKRSNPMVQLKNVGDAIMWTTETAYAVFVAGSIALAAGVATVGGNFVSNIATGGASGLVAQAILGVVGPQIFTPISLLLLALWGAGASMSVYLPLIPFITWVVGVTSWLIIVTEAVCAAPLWMAMHCHPEGPGIAGQHARQGYLMLLEVFARPVLMVLGLASAMLIMYPIAWILNSTFFQAIGSIQQGSITGLFSMVLFIAIYVTFSIALVQRAFSLIHLIPEKVPAWIGGMSRSADPAGELNASKGGFAGVQGVTNSAGSSGIGAAGKGVQKAKDAKKAREDAAKEAASGGENKIHVANRPE